MNKKIVKNMIIFPHLMFLRNLHAYFFTSLVQIKQTNPYKGNSQQDHNDVPQLSSAVYKNVAIPK